MAVGFPREKRDIDNRAGYLALKLREWCEEVAQFKGVLDTLDEDALVALGYTGGENGEVALLKSAITDLDNLRQVAQGQRVQPAASDFFWFARRLWGVQ